MQDAGATYLVRVRAGDYSQALATARNHTLTLNIQKGGSQGFNPAETLLAAIGTCILTNVGSLSRKMRIDILDAWVDLNAKRNDDPPGLTDINYRLVIRSQAERDKLEQLHDLAIRWGTVTNTLAQGVIPHGQLVIQA